MVVPARNRSGEALISGSSASSTSRPIRAMGIKLLAGKEKEVMTV